MTSKSELNRLHRVLVKLGVVGLVLLMSVLGPLPSARFALAQTDIPILESEHPYANDYDNTWNLDYPGAVAVRLHFSRVELEPGADYLVISDVEERRVQVIEDGFNGWSDPVPGEFVKIRLVSDGTVRNWGFAIDQMEDIDYPSLIRSAHPYHNNTDESWTVFDPDPANSEGATQIHFNQVRLEEGVDHLVLSDLEGNPYQVITGDHEDLWSIGIPGQMVNVQLVTDGTVEDWGFSVDDVRTAEASDPLPPAERDTMLESDHPYLDALDETWTIINDNTDAMSTKLHFSQIEVEGGDVLQIMDNEGTVVQEWGPGTDIADLWSNYVPGRVVKVRFRTTDGRFYGWGWRVDGLADGEERTVWAESDHPYPDGVDRTWTIVNPNQEAMSTKLHFSQIEVEGGDVLQIMDNEGTVVQEWGPGTDIADLWSNYVPGRVVKVRFRTTDGRFYGWGWRVDGLADGEERTVWAESDHPYPDGVDRTWTILNPNPNATSTQVHFSQIEVEGGDVLQIMDNEGTVVQEWGPGTKLTDLWSDYVSGRVVKVYFRTTDGRFFGWGWRIDDMQPITAEPITPASVTGVYVNMVHPGTIYLNDSQVAYAQEPGEYKVLLSGLGEHTIHIEYQEYTQDILVTLEKQDEQVQLRVAYPLIAEE